MSNPRVRHTALSMVMCLGLLSEACSGPGMPSGDASIDSSPVPTVTPSASILVTAFPSSDPTATPEQTTQEPPMPEPPAAALSVEGGEPVVGELGTFTWQNGGTDAPWLDGYPIRVASNELLTLTMAEPIAIATWRVSRQPPGSRDGLGAVGIAEGSGEPVTFPAPPPGSWSVNVDIRFAENSGSGNYFWLVEVD